MIQFRMHFEGGSRTIGDGRQEECGWMVRRCVVGDAAGLYRERGRAYVDSYWVYERASFHIQPDPAAAELIYHGTVL